MEGPRLSGIGMTSARTRERLVQRLQEQGIADLRVLDRIRNVPRHLFVDEALATRAYEDTALPIGFGQTISQPFVVARMTEALLAAGPASKVLEIGTGCGYQTAILAELAEQVFSVEIIEELAREGELRLASAAASQSGQQL
jgi:protein-L-isoaspartate(D-aspartate) O-methyltransferase